MRITGGMFRGRILKSTPGLATRPTSDKVRETIFNILMYDIEGACVLDLFAGFGALGIEAISRGAQAAVFVESGQIQAEIIKRNLSSLDLHEDVLMMDFLEACFHLSEGGKKFDLIFADPPYEKVSPQQVTEAVSQYGLLRRNGLLIIEHKSGGVIEVGKMRLLKKRKFGQTEVSFYAGCDS